MATPGPRGVGLFRALRRFRKDRLAFQLWLRETWGDRVRARLGPLELLFLYDPTDYEAIYTGPARNSKRHRVMRLHAEALGEGLLTGDGEHWKKHRRRIAPSFTPSSVQAYLDAFTDETSRGLAEVGATPDLRGLMLDIAMRIAVRTLFGLELGDRLATVEDALRTGQEHFVAHQTSPMILLPRWVPTRSRKRYRGAIDALDRVVFDLIEARRRLPAGEDLLSRLLAARDADGSGFTDRDVRDEVITLFVAGHETSASTLAFAAALLAADPDLQERVHAEVAALPPTADALRQAPLLKAVLDEMLRLYGPAWMSGREAVEDFDLGGLPVAKGTQILMPLWAVHRDGRWYTDPHTFRPGRWLDGSLADLPRHAFVPFGGGRRVCVGNHFAMLELLAVTATLVREYRIEALWDGPIVGEPHITLRPAHPLPVRLQRR